MAQFCLHHRHSRPEAPDPFHANFCLIRFEESVHEDALFLRRPLPSAERQNYAFTLLCHMMKKTESTISAHAPAIMRLTGSSASCQPSSTPTTGTTYS